MAASRQAQGTNRSMAKPATPAGKALSARHLRDNVRFNQAHASDHLKQMATDKKKLKAVEKSSKKESKASVKRAKS